MVKLVKTIVIIATLDTRGDEAKFLKEKIKEKGFRVIVIDAGVMGEPYFKPDITRDEVAEAGGKTLKELKDNALKGAARGEATKVMSNGLNKIVKELYLSGKLDGLVALGGGTGTFLGTTAMKELPIGVPKLQISTHPSEQHFGFKDITMMRSVVDLVGLNSVIKKILTNAAAAITSMAEVGGEIERSPNPTVGITCMGVTTPAAIAITSLLEKRQYECVLFHNRTEPLEEMLEKGWIDGVIDLTANELIDLHIYCSPNRCKPRPNRLAIVGEKALPWIFTPGTLDFGFFPINDPLFKNRKITMHSPVTFLVRTTAEEMKILGKAVAERANKAKGPVAIVIPLRGFSAVDKEGQELYDPIADNAFIDAVKENVEKHVNVVEVDAHINDKEFAEKIVEIFDAMCKIKYIYK